MLHGFCESSILFTVNSVAKDWQLTDKVDDRLLPAKKKEIIDLVISENCNANHFEWGEFDHYKGSQYAGAGTYYRCSRLNYVQESENFYFKFTSEYEHYFPEFSPGIDKRIMGLSQGVDWPYTLRLVTLWLKNLKKEVQILNELRTYKVFDIPDLSEFSRADLSDSFTSNEIGKLESIILEFETKINEQAQLEQHQKIYLRCELQEIKESIKKMNKRAWWKFTLGTFINISFNLANKIDMNDLAVLIKQYVNEIAQVINRGIRLILN